MTIKEDHEHFRNLIEKTVTRAKKFGLDDDVRVRLYESESFFAKTYPDETQRKRMLKEMEENAKARETAYRLVKNCAPKFDNDAMSGRKI